MPKPIAETDLSEGTTLEVYLCACVGGLPLKHAFLVVDHEFVAGPFLSRAGLVSFAKTRLMEDDSPMYPEELPGALNFVATLTVLPDTAMPFDLAAGALELQEIDEEPFAGHMKFDDNETEVESPRFKDKADGQAKFILCGCGGHGWIVDGLGHVLADDLVTQPHALEVLKILIDQQAVSIFDQSKVTREVKESKLLNPAEVGMAALV